MSGGELDSNPLRPFPAAENAGFTEEFDQSSHWPKPNEHPELILNIQNARDSARFPNALPNAPLLRAPKRSASSDPFPCMDLFLPNSLRLEGLALGPTVEPGCSTRLLDDERCGLKSAQRSLRISAPAICGDDVTIQNCPSDAFFLHWNWPAIRLGCCVLLFSCFVAMVCVVVGVLVAGNFPCNPAREWWQGTVMYEIFPSSFQDTDGDGYGDLRGILQHLDYIDHLHVSAIRLNSIFCALDYPLEYEHIIDFSNVDPHLGKIQDFEALVEAVHARNMYIVLDINPTLTSDEHTWAAHWQRNIPGYENFYVTSNESLKREWPEMEAVNHLPEWEIPHRTFGRQAYLNWSNPIVQREILGVLRFWLDHGVDGFFMKHLEKMRVEKEDQRFLIIRQWRELLNGYRLEGRSKLLMSSISLVEHLQSLGSPYISAILTEFDLLDVPLQVEVNHTDGIPGQIAKVQALATLSPFPWISWHLGSADTFRLSSRLDHKFSLSAFFLLMVLPGSISIFYGDEIGLPDSYDVITNRMYRGGQFYPMQWSSEIYGNFTDTTPWIPVYSDQQNDTANVENQFTKISLISDLIKFKNSSVPLAMDSIFDEKSRSKKPNYKIHYADSSVLAFERFYPRRPRFLLCVNFGEQAETRDLSQIFYEVNVRLSSTFSKTGYFMFHELSLEGGEAFIGELTT